ncbi:Hypothetical protein KVN_LOCUS284 [uncultured virus]|nr:Hypothetical protein KVN_LOCUS284 [uncultured virus]
MDQNKINTKKNKKQKNIDEKDFIFQEKKDLLDKLFIMYPYLETEKNHIFSTCLNVINEEKNIKQINDEKKILVLEQFSHENKTFFKDKQGGIWNDEGDLIGSISEYDKENNPICEFFDKKYDIDLDFDNKLF